MPPYTSPAYVQTSLPVLLDLQNRDTREQIQSGVSRASAQLELSVAEQSKADCERIMVASCSEFVKKEGKGSPLSREKDYALFWEWVREFHSEYNEEWFTRNMPRLKSEFHPSWTRTLKQELEFRKAQPQTSPDLLYDGPDLLGDAPPATNLLVNTTNVLLGASIGPATGGGLLDLLGHKPSGPSSSSSTSSGGADDILARVTSGAAVWTAGGAARGASAGCGLEDLLAASSATPGGIPTGGMPASGVWHADALKILNSTSAANPAAKSLSKPGLVSSPTGNQIASPTGRSNEDPFADLF